jgi:hypothetical protein
MTWWGWLLLGTNLFGYQWVWRRLTWRFAYRFLKSENSHFPELRVEAPDGFLWAAGILCGAFYAIIWPLWIVTWYVPGASAQSMFVPPPSEKRALKEEGLKRRIAELEKEAGIR